jgi:hypothetical protein
VELREEVGGYQDKIMPFLQVVPRKRFQRVDESVDHVFLGAAQIPEDQRRKEWNHNKLSFRGVESPPRVILQLPIKE